jgi:hypothetical protein
MSEMDRNSNRLGFWSAAIITLLVIMIDLGMGLSAALIPMTTITDIETYAATFSSWQMLPLVPSLMMALLFPVLMLCIYRFASPAKKTLGLLAFAFSMLSAGILCFHYYIQLTVVQQGLLSNQLTGLWLFASPNPHSLFWALSALGYGIMGIALIAAAPIFKDGRDRKIGMLLYANGAIGLIFLVGIGLGLIEAGIITSFVWGALFPIATALIAITFKRASNPG